MIGLIAPQYRVIAAAAALAALSAASAYLGMQVGDWRATARHAEAATALRDQLAMANNQKHELELAIAQANQGIAVAQAQTQAAEQARAQAQQHADDLSQLSQSRIDKLTSAVATATGCGDLLKRYWEIRK